MKHYNKYRIESGIPPYKYSFVSNKDGCITFDVPNGTTDTGITDVNIVVPTENCYSPSLSLTLYIEDAKGCKNSIDSNLLNPCTTFLAPKVNLTGSGYGTYKFAATPIGGQGAFTYSWDYPKDIFQTKDSKSQNLILTTTFSGAAIPKYNSPYPITVTVTDANGCERKTTYNYTFCRLQTQNISLGLACYLCPGSVGGNIDFREKITGCKDSSINWDTLNITVSEESFSDAVSVTNNGDGTALICVDKDILYSSGWDATTYSNTLKLNWTVEDSKGLISDTSDIYLYFEDCNPKTYSCIEAKSYDYEIDSCSTITTKYIDLDSLIIPNPNSTTNYSSFKFKLKGSQTYTSNDPKKLNFSFGNATINNNRQIVIDITSIPSGGFTINSEIIAWQICDNDGCCTGDNIITMILRCNTAPTGVNSTVCATCNTPKQIPVLDTPYVSNPTSLSTGSEIVVTTIPTYGDYTIGTLTTGTIKKGIIYTPNPSYYGADSIIYEIIDDNGKTSNPITMTLNVICPGVGESATTCP